MSKWNTLIRVLKTNRQMIPQLIVNNLIKKKMLNWLPDKPFLKLRYWTIFGRKLNLRDPKTFNEKLQWIKLYDRNPEYTTMVDKYAVREYIAQAAGSEYLIPLLGRWDRVEDIDFDCLPDRFVLKCNHDSGCVVICKDKATFDRQAACTKLKKQLKKSLYWWGREWPYKNVKPCIIAEQYMEDANGELNDYKFMCFNGEAKCSFVCSNRFDEKGLHITILDRDWNVMPVERDDPSVKEGLPKPQRYDEMLQLADKLAQGISFVRVDFYEVDGKIYFGELTFFPGCGFKGFRPEQWDEIFGSWIKLPPVTK